MLRKLSSVMFVLAGSVWCHQATLWAITDRWTPLTARDTLTWVGLPVSSVAPPWLLEGNLGLLALLAAVVLFYLSFPTGRFAARLRTAQERRDLAERVNGVR
ncbi:MAG TPA: hypothetical protein VEB64_08510 [Azospirillaceae bacterium]|nr:hypothetical protein [Azospirillaceae bacterium]